MLKNYLFQDFAAILNICIILKDLSHTSDDKAGHSKSGPMSSPHGAFASTSQESTPLVKTSPKMTVQLPSPPEYVIYTDTELEQVRKHYFEMARNGQEQDCVMSKELRCRLVRNTVTSMISILRASSQKEDIKYPSKQEVIAMAKRLVEYYPMLQDNTFDEKHVSNHFWATYSIFSRSPTFFFFFCMCASWTVCFL